LYKALTLAKLEKSTFSRGGVASTYFVLLTTNFYNVSSKKSSGILSKILSLGCDIGLHFDEARYDGITGNPELFAEAVQNEARILGRLLGTPVKSVSMHRPSSFALNSDLKFDGLENSYSKKYFSEFKYLSDSRMHWRENADEIVASRQFDKLHILTHAFWYEERQETTAEKICRFINDARRERFYDLTQNFKNLEEYVKLEDVI
jgi:hypothetical protein